MVNIKDCDFKDPVQRQAIIDLMNHYMASDMGGKLPPYSNETAHTVVQGLEHHPSRIVLLAEYQGEYVGLSNSFINFGTFAGKPFINIHDIVVLEKYRGLGIGRKMMEAIDAKAKELGCGKITLEVRDDNTRAQKLYKSMRFNEGTPVMHFWSKYFK
jgi:ribosomal protein S18 acetylase RimI-like enzyme